MILADQTTKTRIYLLRFLILILIGVTLYALQVLNDAKTTYDGVSKMVASEPVIAKVASIDGNKLVIPTYQMFHQGHLWALVSKKRPLKGEAGYTLVNIPVAHGDSDQPMKVAKNISDQLERMINAAEADGEPLMVSSAYRSLSEQHKLYNQFVAENGKALAALYVSPVGASEHHTGLSVDLSSVSDDCSEDSDTCSLSQTGAAWLAKNAARFGFIQRYPSGKENITGINHEPWHYRYVGIPMAKAMNDTGMTFDEVIQQIAPGYSSKQ